MSRPPQSYCPTGVVVRVGDCCVAFLRRGFGIKAFLVRSQWGVWNAAVESRAELLMGNWS